MNAGEFPPLKNIFDSIKCNIKFKDILTKYSVHGVVEVKIGISDTDEILYCISEPSLKKDEKLFNELVKLVDIIFSSDIDPLTIYNPSILRELSIEHKLDYKLLASNMTKITYFINKAVSGYGKLYPLMKDKYIEEVVANKPGSRVLVFHRLYNHTWLKTNIVLKEEELNDIALKLARIAGRELSIAHPYVEAPLPDGNRIAATFSNEVTRFGSSLVIRKHLDEPLTPSELVKAKMISALYLAYLWLLLLSRAAIVIAGPTASGKTTLLQALLLLLPPTDRIVTIEDTPEINLRHHENWDSLVTRTVSNEAIGESIDMLDLTKFALRRRPDYFVIGEIRGEEAKTFIHAAASGHGALTTFHADSAFSVISRLKAEPINIGESFLQLIWAIVVLKKVRLGNGAYARRVVEIYEVKPSGSGLELHRLAYWDRHRDRLLPDSISELVEGSFRLDVVSHLLFNSKEELINKLNEFQNIINNCINCNYLQFIDRIKKYYNNEALRAFGIASRRKS